METRRFTSNGPLVHVGEHDRRPSSGDGRCGPMGRGTGRAALPGGCGSPGHQAAIRSGSATRRSACCPIGEVDGLNVEVHGGGVGNLHVLGAMYLPGLYYERGLLHPFIDYDVSSALGSTLWSTRWTTKASSTSPRTPASATTSTGTTSTTTWWTDLPIELGSWPPGSAGTRPGRC